MTHGRAATDAGGQDRPHVRRTIEDPAMRCHPAAVALLLLAGCASTPKPEPMPTLVKVPVVEYVRVPDSLTKPCPVPRVASRTVEAVELGRSTCRERVDQYGYDSGVRGQLK